MTNAHHKLRRARWRLFATRDPVRYRWSLYLRLWLGVVPFLLWLGLYLVLGVAALLAQTDFWRWLAVGLLFGYALLSLWMLFKLIKVGLLPHLGFHLKPEKFPALTAILDEMQQTFATPAIAGVFLHGKLDVSLIALPQTAIGGRVRHYLLIGLPLLQCLTVAELRAMLAREHALLHLTRHDHAARLRLRRRRLTQLQAALEQLPLSWPLRWYLGLLDYFRRDYIDASFELARQVEGLMDQQVAEKLGNQALATALISLEIMDSFLEHAFWPTLKHLAIEHDTPPFLPNAQLGLAMSVGIDPNQARGWLLEKKWCGELFAHPRPPLRDRLQAIDWKRFDLPSLPPKPSAAETLLGRQLSPIVTALDQRWRKTSRNLWSQWHKEYQHQRNRCEQLRKLHGGQRPLTLAETMELAQLNELFAPAQTSIPLYREVLGLEPNHPEAHLAIGRLFLAQDDDRGLQHLETAMHYKPDLTATGCQLAFNFLLRKGQADDANRYEERAQRHCLRI